ncbi:PilZ domain-containing protein [Limimonas halophila]|uniref:PilZ domain-containing protein n=1 Tax=Limimonas halophila TaxID=1082479 RepID=A0A1G7UFG1_9PROT|nr:PilZ domain-containing protein [Limimonas halophila]SDG45799.1 PilZ domain-containing protein [Limimonas halophila]
MTPDAPTTARERRKHRRVRVLWSARLRFPEETAELNCTVANVSGGGAKLTHVAWPAGEEARVVDRLEPGVAVRLSIAGTAEIPAEVVWCARGRMGVQFHLPAADVAARLGQTVDLRNP